ncbi:MAG: hypothetical protein N2322_07955, partial [Terrimicrobiaceae bacterium]|nr:hypothetical protein [Terrimicrobiaceae bacterium]
VGAAYPPTWTSNWLGVGSVNLVNDGWYALSISEPDYTSNTPGPAFAAIPEPSAALLVACGSGLLILFHARKRLHAG